MAVRRLGLFAPPATGAATGAPTWTPARAAVTVGAPTAVTTPASPAASSTISVTTAATPAAAHRRQFVSLLITPFPNQPTSPAFPLGQRRI